MWTSGQNVVGGHTVTIYNPGGDIVRAYTMDASVPNGATQATVLIGDSAAPGNPDFTDNQFKIPADGGAVCFNDAERRSTASPGVISPEASIRPPARPRSATRLHRAAMTGGQALRRDISGGCPSFLEQSDDTDDSATDFDAVTPGPRNNAAAIHRGRLSRDHCRRDQAREPDQPHHRDDQLQFQWRLAQAARPSNASSTPRPASRLHLTPRAIHGRRGNQDVQRQIDGRRSRGPDAGHVHVEGRHDAPDTTDQRPETGRSQPERRARPRPSRPSAPLPWASRSHLPLPPRSRAARRARPSRHARLLSYSTAQQTGPLHVRGGRGRPRRATRTTSAAAYGWMVDRIPA